MYCITGSNGGGDAAVVGVVRGDEVLDEEHVRVSRSLHTFALPLRFLNNKIMLNVCYTIHRLTPVLRKVDSGGGGGGVLGSNILMQYGTVFEPGYLK